MIKDSTENNPQTVGAKTLGAGEIYNISVQGLLGLGATDAVRLFEPGPGTMVDSLSWSNHAAFSYGRCPDGTGIFLQTTASTPGTTNNCPSLASPWPGSTDVSVVDTTNVFGQNLSGLAYQPSGSGARGVLWGVQNNPSTLYRLLFDGTNWARDTANNWGAGKTLLFPGGGGAPDAEGVTLAGGDANGIYVSSERDGNVGATSRPSVLRYDVTAAGATLTATKEWDLTAQLPGLGSNLGPEAIAWVPDDLLVSKGFTDESKAAAYNPSDYPDHGSGVFFLGIEQDGKVYGYVLQNDGTATKVATIVSGFPAVMDLEYEPESTHLWVVCDDTCSGRTSTLDIAPAGDPNAGKLVVTHTYERPAKMPMLNNEGFAIAPQAECVNSLKPVFYADDTNDDSHALRSGFISCTVPTPPSSGGGTPTPPGGSPGTPPPGDTLPPDNIPPPDKTAPGLTLGLKLSKRGTFAVRRTGKFGVRLTLGERANLGITVAARKNKRTKFRTLLRAKRTGVAAGTRTITLALARKVRLALGKGWTLKVTVKATDAAGNARTRSATGVVP